MLAITPQTTRLCTCIDCELSVQIVRNSLNRGAFMSHSSCIFETASAMAIRRFAITGSGWTSEWSCHLTSVERFDGEFAILVFTSLSFRINSSIDASTWTLRWGSHAARKWGMKQRDETSDTKAEGTNGAEKEIKYTRDEDSWYYTRKYLGYYLTTTDHGDGKIRCLSHGLRGGRAYKYLSSTL